MRFVSILCILLFICPSISYANESYNDYSETESICESCEDDIMPYSSDYFKATSVNITSTTTGYVDVVAEYSLRDGYNKISISIELYETNTLSYVGSYEKTLTSASVGSVSKSFKATSGNSYYCVAYFNALDSNGNILEIATKTSTYLTCK